MMNVDEIEADCAAKAALSIGAVDVALDILRRAGLLCELCSRMTAYGWLAVQSACTEDQIKAGQRPTNVARTCHDCARDFIPNAPYVAALSTTIAMPTMFRLVTHRALYIGTKTGRAIWLIA